MSVTVQNLETTMFALLPFGATVWTATRLIFRAFGAVLGDSSCRDVSD
jgi:hypothetical protein